MNPSEGSSPPPGDKQFRREMRKTRYLIALAVLFAAMCVCMATEPTDTPALLAGFAFFVVCLGYFGGD